MEPAGKPNPCVYVARRPENTVLYEVVASELEAFVGRTTTRGSRIPPFIERTLRDYLACGVPGAGFVRVRCDRCGHDQVLAFSCKRRGICPSCNARRMADTAADLVDFVIPHVGVRQWVLSVPFALRYRLAYDRTLLTPVLGAFLRAVFRSHRHRVFRRYGVRHGKCGAVAFVQRFGGALNLNVHFHVLVLEGAYQVPPTADQVRFLPLRAPSDDDVRQVLADAASRIGRQLERRGPSEGYDASEADMPALEDPVVAALYAASVQSRIPSGPHAGEPTVRMAEHGRVAPTRDAPPPLCAVGHGLSLHAGVYIAPTDRERLERICRYTGRPALAVERLRRLPDGRISYRMRNPWRDGSTHVVMEPSEFMAKLAALIPPPRQHQVRYYGILAPSAAWRDHVVPSGGHDRPKQSSNGKPSTPAGRRPWAELMRRVFALDVLECPRCTARMRVLSAALDQATARSLLLSLGLDARPPPIRKAEPR